MPDNLHASPQADGGPAFAARQIDGLWYPVSLPPDFSALEDVGGNLAGGTATLDAQADARYRFVQCADIEPLFVQCGIGGPMFALEPASFVGGPGGIWPPLGHAFVFTGALILTSTKQAAQFFAGWA